MCALLTLECGVGATVTRLCGFLSMPGSLPRIGCRNKIMLVWKILGCYDGTRSVHAYLHGHTRRVYAWHPSQRSGRASPATMHAALAPRVFSPTRCSLLQHLLDLCPPLSALPGPLATDGFGCPARPKHSCPRTIVAHSPAPSARLAQEPGRHWRCAAQTAKSISAHSANQPVST